MTGISAKYITSKYLPRHGNCNSRNTGHLSFPIDCRCMWLTKVNTTCLKVRSFCSVSHGKQYLLCLLDTLVVENGKTITHMVPCTVYNYMSICRIHVVETRVDTDGSDRRASHVHISSLLRHSLNKDLMWFQNNFTVLTRRNMNAITRWEF